LEKLEKEINQKIRDIKTKLLRLQMIQNLETNSAFLDIGTKIAENLEKLKLGAVNQAVGKFLPILLNKNLDSIKVKNSLRLNKITDEISNDIDQIFAIISKSLKISEEDRKSLIGAPSKGTENLASTSKD